MTAAKYLSGFIAFLVAGFLLVSLTACGGQSEKMDGSMDMPKTIEEASKQYDELMKQENEIFSKNQELWEKVFLASSKDMTMIEDNKNYGDFLLKVIEEAKDQFSDDELKLLKEEAEKVRDIENKLIKLEEKFPELAMMRKDAGMSASDSSMNMQMFPEFEGKDLKGNTVNSKDLFSNNKFTVVNFWFTTCSPCVGELNSLEALNKDFEKMGGELIGVNSFTLGGSEKSIMEANEVLDKKGATFRNVYFDENSEAGKFANGVYAYPTTYVVDSKGNIVGDPIVGVLTEKAQKDKLMRLIDQAMS